MKASILNRELSFSGFISIIWAWSSFMFLLPFYILKLHSHTHSLDLYLHELESSLNSLVESFPPSDLTSRSVLSLLKGLQKIISWHQGTSVWPCLEFPSGKVILSSLYKTGSIFSGKDDVWDAYSATWDDKAIWMRTPLLQAQARILELMILSWCCLGGLRGTTLLQEMFHCG